MTGKFTIYADRVFDGYNFLQQAQLTINDGVITAIDTYASSSAADYHCEGLLVPGFIDVQVNGGGGVLLNQQASLAGINTMMAAHTQFGTTAMLPTLITDSITVMEQAADAIAQAIANKTAGILGIHFEGPHLSVAKKGAHSAQYIRPISDREWQVLSRKDIGQVMVTVAPENVLADDIARMVELGIKVSLGHSNADYQTAQRAMLAGANSFTHLYNAMSPLTSREPGMVGCALANDHAYCGLILDGHHVDYVSAKIAIKTKSAGKVLLVTDAMPPVGTTESEFAFFDRVVTLNNGKLTSTTGELAGSVLDMATAVRNCHQHLAMPLGEALRMASLYPAQYLGIADYVGSLCVGGHADMVLLDNDLFVQQTWISGKQIF